MRTLWSACRTHILGTQVQIRVEISRDSVGEVGRRCFLFRMLSPPHHDPCPLQGVTVVAYHQYLSRGGVAAQPYDNHASDSTVFSLDSVLTKDRNCHVSRCQLKTYGLYSKASLFDIAISISKQCSHALTWLLVQSQVAVQAPREWPIVGSLIQA